MAHIVEREREGEGGRERGESEREGGEVKRASLSIVLM